MLSLYYGQKMAYSITHERTHDLVNCIAMRRAGISENETFGPIQLQLFREEQKRINTDVYLYCFTDESLDEINSIIGKEISPRARVPGELLPEGMVAKVGLGESNLAAKIYSFLIKEWN